MMSLIAYQYHTQFVAEIPFLLMLIFGIRNLRNQYIFHLTKEISRYLTTLQEIFLFAIYLYLQNLYSIENGLKNPYMSWCFVYQRFLDCVSERTKLVVNNCGMSNSINMCFYILLSLLVKMLFYLDCKYLFRTAQPFVGFWPVKRNKYYSEKPLFSPICRGRT